MPSNVKKHHKSTEPESRQMAKMFFFLCSSSSDGPVQNCVTLSQWFLHKTTVFYTHFTYHPYLVALFLLSLHLVSLLMFYNLVHYAMYAVCLV